MINPKQAPTAGAKKRRRLLIVTDGENWFVRRVASVTHDGIKGEAVYHCDRPIGRRYSDIASAVREAKSALSNPRARAWRDS